MKNVEYKMKQTMTENKTVWSQQVRDGDLASNYSNYSNELFQRTDKMLRS